jgi:hypothetical protein
MERVPLITVEKTFCLRSDSHPERCVLVIDPRLRVPSAGWRERTETVSVLRPDGRKFEAAAQISLSHLNIKMEARDLSMDQRWRVTILFQGLTSDDVPDGSKIFVSHETREALLPKAVA